VIEKLIKEAYITGKNKKKCTTGNVSSNNAQSGLP